MTFSARCTPVLIGSLPLTSHEEAMRLIASATPEIPLWPQLPKQAKEGMVRQFVTGFPGLVDQDGRSYVDTSREDFTFQMTSFYDELLRVESDPSLLTNSRFGLGQDSAPGFPVFMRWLNDRSLTPLTTKGQVTGPITTGVGITDQTGQSIIADDNLRDILIQLLTMKARWQVSRMLPYTGENPPLIFIDEPGMVSFGSSGFAGISEEMVVETVNRIIDGIHTEGGLAGIHICANGDWGPALSSKADIISFDAYFYFENFILFKEQLCEYLQKGKILAWGIVPTGDPQAVEKESTESLFAKWQEQLTTLCSFGFSERTIMEQTLIAPSCGTGSLSPDLATKVLTMTKELSLLARAQLNALTNT